MAESDPKFYERALRRIGRIMVALGVLGSLGLVVVKGIWIGVSFLIGAAVSYLSFWGWQQVANALGPGPKKPSSWKFILRIAVLVALAYVIIKFLGLNVAAAVSGLLVSAAAVTLEVVYEL